jgi:hypothetical protein
MKYELSVKLLVLFFLVCVSAYILVYFLTEIPPRGQAGFLAFVILTGLIGFAMFSILYLMGYPREYYIKRPISKERKTYIKRWLILSAFLFLGLLLAILIPRPCVSIEEGYCMSKSLPCAVEDFNVAPLEVWGGYQPMPRDELEEKIGEVCTGFKFTDTGFYCAASVSDKAIAKCLNMYKEGTRDLVRQGVAYVTIPDDAVVFSIKGTLTNFRVENLPVKFVNFYKPGTGSVNTELKKPRRSPDARYRVYGTRADVKATKVNQYTTCRDATFL